MMVVGIESIMEQETTTVNLQKRWYSYKQEADITTKPIASEAIGQFPYSQQKRVMLSTILAQVYFVM